MSSSQDFPLQAYCERLGKFRFDFNRHGSQCPEDSVNSILQGHKRGIGKDLRELVTLMLQCRAHRVRMFYKVPTVWQTTQGRGNTTGNRTCGVAGTWRAKGPGFLLDLHLLVTK